MWFKLTDSYARFDWAISFYYTVEVNIYLFIFIYRYVSTIKEYFWRDISKEES